MDDVTRYPDRPVLGVDGCRAGWVALLWRPDGSVDVRVGPEVALLVETHFPEAEVVGIDMPIGLPVRGRRQADLLARKALPGKSSSVFSTLLREVYEAPDYAAGRTRMLAVTANEPDGPRSCSAQAWALGRKVLEVDDWVHSGPGRRVVEVHPEVSFAEMAGAPVLAAKRRPEGEQRRRELLTEQGMMPPTEAPRGAATDDLLDACAAAWSAARVARGEAYSLPEPPETLSDGWPAAIHV